MAAADNAGRAGRLWAAAPLVGLFALALAFRLWDLDHLPGVNGDEAYYGTLVLDLKAGRPRALSTASGLFLNPFYSGPLFLIHRAAQSPSFWTLRLVALFSGLAAVALAYPLLVRVFDRTTALGTALLLACLPIAIAYSRFGWDQSQSPLITLICLYFATKRNLRWTLYSLLAALIVHPAHLFLLPILLGPVTAEGIVHWWQMEPARRQLWLRRSLLGLAGLVVLGVVALLVGPQRVREGVLRVREGIGQRLTTPASWGRFLLLYGDLLTGNTIYRYIPGQPPAWETTLQRTTFWGLVLLLGFLALPRLIRRRDLTVLGLIGGLVASLFGFYLVFGHRWMVPGLERYVMWLIVASCLVLVLLLENTGENRLARGLQATGLLLACAVLLFGFYQNYFAVLYRTGGDSHRAFRTGPVEPKRAAFAAIVESAGGQPITILAEDWWCYYPIRYLGCVHPEIEVLLCRKPDAEKIDVTSQGRRFLVGFARGAFHRRLELYAPELKPTVINDYAGRPVLLVWDMGERTDLLKGLVSAASEAPEDRLPEW